MSRQNRFRKYTLLGVEIDAVTMQEAAEHIAAHCKERSFYVTKPYVEFLDRAADDHSIRDLLDGSELCLADGVSLSWAAHYLYGGRRTLSRLLTTLAEIVLAPDKLKDTLPERFAGTDFTWHLLQLCRDQGLSIFIVGSPRGGSIEKTRVAIEKRLPGIRIAGTFPGELGGKTGQALYETLTLEPVEAELAEAISRSGADIVLIGMGFPLQELLMSKLVSKLKRGALVGEGGTFDYGDFGGAIKRAPVWMRRLGMEWAWRLILEPSTRVKRQMAIPRFILRVWKSRNT